ncbi:hypothetical protein G0W03_03190 [Staphylococcus aureus]|nr:hypothetical protein [Staphylococcus aureus]
MTRFLYVCIQRRNVNLPSHNDDLPYAELALGAGMAFLIRRFTKKDQQTEE